MSPRTPDKALRRVVAELAALHRDDVSAILDQLDEAGRSAVEDLLREFAAYFDQAPSKPREPQRSFDRTRLSPWLVESLSGAGDSSVTPHARRALRNCAVRICPAPANAARKTGRRLFASQRRSP